MKTRTFRNIILAVVTGLAIGTAYANEVIDPNPNPEPPPTCATNPGAPPTTFTGKGCGTGCSPYPDGCCEYKTYVENNETKTWRKCNLLKVCSNLTGGSNGFQCNTPSTEDPTDPPTPE